MKHLPIGSWTCLLFVLQLAVLKAQSPGNYPIPAAGNPIIPGYFADPTVKKFGDTYYLYSTTDGNGGGYGPSQVWISKDFVNWTMKTMNWPASLHFWAPDVTQGKDGRYYMYYCQPTVEIYGASGDTPVGPWLPLFSDEQPIVKNYQVPDVITLDGQTFRDDDGKFYMFWGTWGIYPNSGCGIGLLNDDMKTFSKLEKLPNTIAKDFFEAPFMFKRKGIYYLLYSSGRCEDDTYRVQYVSSKTGPMGPFEYGQTNPILSTSIDGTVHGPGHQSVIEHRGEYYLIYHRHNNPHSNGGFHRQICVDKLVFDANGTIEKVVPTHTGIGPLGPLQEKFPDLAFTKSVIASSFYDADFKPEFAVDAHNGTLWKPRNNTGEAWIQIDLGSVKPVKRIHTQFEYATWYYQYLWEYSVDGLHWTIYADQRKNTTMGSPMVDAANVRARYLKLTITDTQYPGLNKAVWNIYVYSSDRSVSFSGKQAVAASASPSTKPRGLLVDLSADSLLTGLVMHKWQNRGLLEGEIKVASRSMPRVDLVAGRKAVVFSGKEYFQSSTTSFPTLAGNSSWTVAMWVYNPVIGEEEPILSWTPRGGRELSNVSVGYGRNRNWGAVAHWGWPDLPYKKVPEASQWHHLAVTFDGTMERIYVDGVLDQADRKMLFAKTDQPLVIGTNGDHSSFYSGAVSSLKLYDLPLSAEEIRLLAQQINTSPILLRLDAATLPYGPVTRIPNDGYGEGDFRIDSGNASVQDVQGKLAVVIPAGTVLNWQSQINKVLPVTNYSTVAVFLGREKNWTHQIQVYQNQQIKTYVNGLLTDTQTSSETIATGSLTNRMIASYQLYNYPLSAKEITGMFTDWKASSIEPDRPVIHPKPVAMTPYMIEMSVQAGQPDKFYWFEETGSKQGSGWLSDPVFIAYGRSPNHTYTYVVKVRDAYGNVSPASDPVSILTTRNQFHIFNDSFEQEHDFGKEGIQRTFWDGYIGNHTNETALQIKSKAGRLRLESIGSQWDGSSPKGPFLYKTVTGDFVVQVQVADVSGLSEKKTNGANDAGLMVRLPQKDATASENLIQNSVFPGWGIGNMVTNLSAQGREQTPNLSAWKFDRYLQIQRKGNVFFVRSSNDGRVWTDLPGSPVVRLDWLGQAVQVGLFQATYGPRHGYGEFVDFELFEPK